MKTEYQITKYACYMVNVSMSVVATLPPLLFVTFRTLYGISYSLLGTLILINFCTQLLVDLIFSFYSQRFDISKTVRLTPILTVAGLLIYALFPMLFPQAVYLGLVAGTIVFAASGGLAEVLISPVIAAIPSDRPESEMSKLHSVYAWGVVGVVFLSTGFLRLFGRENWKWLILIWAVVPLIASILFQKAKIPTLNTPAETSNVWKLATGKRFLVCFFCIFLGGASECTMSQWSSSFLEQALGIPKVWGDILGVAAFAVMLGLGRSLYAKFGRNIYKVLLAGAAGAVVCYLCAGIFNYAVVGLTACALTGLCTAMLWPGSLIVASDRFPDGGVAVFALMAAGGDLGGSVGPQLVGIVTDAAMQNDWVISLAESWQLSAEQLGMKIGLLSASIFPVLAVVLFWIVYRKQKHAAVR